jgi:hypothetical protein
MYLGIEKGVVVDEMCEVILRLTAYAKEFNRGFGWADMSSSASEERKVKVRIMAGRQMRVHE